MTLGIQVRNRKDKHMDRHFIVLVENNLGKYIMYSRRTHAVSRERFEKYHDFVKRYSESRFSLARRYTAMRRTERLVVLVTRSIVRNDYFHHILESKAALLELFVSTDQRMRCPRGSTTAPSLAAIFASAFLDSGASTQLIANGRYRCQDFHVSRFTFRSQ